MRAAIGHRHTGKIGHRGPFIYETVINKGELHLRNFNNFL